MAVSLSGESATGTEHQSSKPRSTSSSSSYSGKVNHTHDSVAHPGVAAQDKNILADTYAAVNPAAVQREIQTLTDRLLKMTISKAAATAKPAAVRRAS